MLVVDGNKTAFNRNKCVRVTVKQNVSYQSQYVNILFCRFDSIYYCSTVQQKMLPSGQHRYRSLAAETSGTMGVDLSEIINVTPPWLKNDLFFLTVLTKFLLVVDLFLIYFSLVKTTENISFWEEYRGFVCFIGHSTGIFGLTGRPFQTKNTYASRMYFFITKIHFFCQAIRKG